MDPLWIRGIRAKVQQPQKSSRAGIACQPSRADFVVMVRQAFGVSSVERSPCTALHPEPVEGSAERLPPIHWQAGHEKCLCSLA